MNAHVHPLFQGIINSYAAAYGLDPADYGADVDVECPTCHGTGEVDIGCPHCSGTGDVPFCSCKGEGYSTCMCEDCHGRGIEDPKV